MLDRFPWLLSPSQKLPPAKSVTIFISKGGGKQTSRTCALDFSERRRPVDPVEHIQSQTCAPEQYVNLIFPARPARNTAKHACDVHMPSTYLASQASKIRRSYSYSGGTGPGRLHSTQRDRGAMSLSVPSHGQQRRARGHVPAAPPRAKAVRGRAPGTQPHVLTWPNETPSHRRAVRTRRQCGERERCRGISISGSGTGTGAPWPRPSARVYPPACCLLPAALMPRPSSFEDGHSTGHS